MNPEQEEFQKLRRLLVLKRHEQPPPGYFDNFSRQVILRIRASESEFSCSIFEVLSRKVPWLHGLFDALQTKPILAGGFGFAVCSLLLAGVAFSENPTVPPELGGGPAVTAMAAPSVHAGVSAAPFVYRAPVQAEPVAEVIVPGQPRNSLFQQLTEVPAPGRALLISSPATGAFAP